MARSVSDDLRLVLDAARQHYRNDRHWRPVQGPAYFEANLKRVENRTELGEAIDQLEKRYPEIVRQLD